jgi:uncharacterized protein YkwD
MVDIRIAIILSVIAFIGILILFLFQMGQLDPYIEALQGGWDDLMKWLFGDKEELPYFEPPVNLDPPPVPENMSYLELKTFIKINERRQLAGLKPLKWNHDLAYVGRLYSQDMASSGFFGHVDPRGGVHDDRLHKQGVYYYNASAENLAQIYHASSYTYIEETGQIINKTYKGLDELIGDAVEGWMNSTSHRENIEHELFDESGIGVAYDNNTDTFIFTQIFVTRVRCGYRGASCCYTAGFLPWCYSPLGCVDGRCGR